MDANADFLARRTAPGVFRSVDWDSPASLGKIGGGNWLNQSFATIGAFPDNTLPKLDPDVKASGASSLRFDLPGQHGGNYGQWGARFSDDNSLQIRDNQSLYLQVRFRVNRALLKTFFYSGGAGGSSGSGFFQDGVGVITGAMKLSDNSFSVPGDLRTTFVRGRYVRTFFSGNTSAPWSTYAYGRSESCVFDAVSGRTIVVLNINNGGDADARVPLHPQMDSVQAPAGNGAQGGRKLLDITQGARGTTDPGTSPNVKLVLQTYYNQNFPQLYQSNADVGLRATMNGFTNFQNKMPAPFCDNSFMPVELDRTDHPGCWMPEADTWMALKLGIDLFDLVIGSSGKTASWDWRCRMWGQVEDDPSVLILDWNKDVKGYFRLNADDPAMNYGLGKTNVFPYFTNKDPKQSHGLCQCWYDELILSTQDIPDVGASKIIVPPPTTEDPPVGGEGDEEVPPTQDQLDQTVADTKKAYNSARAAAGLTDLDTDIANQIQVAKDAQQQTFNTQLSDLKTAFKSKLDLMAQDDANEDQHRADAYTLTQ